MRDLVDTATENLYERIAAIIESAQAHVTRTVNTAMVHAYWWIGREIVEQEQLGRSRAGYGDRLVDSLSARLTERFGRGFTSTSLKRMRQFYKAFPNGSALPESLGGPPKGATLRHLSASSKKGTALRHLSASSPPLLFPPHLSWTHYRVLLSIENPTARAFYEIEAAREGWPVRELERQIASRLFERLAKSRNKKQVLALAKEGQRIASPLDVLKDPFVLEFLHLEHQPTWLERDLEQAIMDRLQEFLLELGKGFCFVARQRRITLDGDHFYIDLVFYNRLLKCFVLIDLKMGKLTHQDLGQMQMYVNFFDRYQRESWEAKTVGIVLCSEKNDTVVKITLPEENEQILTARYQLFLPSEEELRLELTRGREQTEQALELRKDAKAPVPPPSRETHGANPAALASPLMFSPDASEPTKVISAPSGSRRIKASRSPR